MRVLVIDSNPVLKHLLAGGFKDLGHDVTIVGSITSSERINNVLSRVNPDLVLTQGWGMEQCVDRQEWIRDAVKARGIPHVYWSVEDPLFTDVFVWPLIERMKPDYVFTICESAVDLFRSRGVKASYLDWGFHSPIHHLGHRLTRYRKQVAVVGNAYDHLWGMRPMEYKTLGMKTLIAPLVQSGIDVHFWGKSWDIVAPWLGIRIPKRCIHGEVSYKRTRKIYHSAKIVIGLQNLDSQVTQRIYEVLASGGFLLTMDNPAIRARFRPGRDLIVSSSPKETVRLANYYLSHRAERRLIRGNGYRAVQTHRYKYRVEEMLRVLYQEGIVSL